MIRFAIWAAVSTEQQATADKASLSEQEAQCRARALSKGWVESHASFVVPGESRTRWVNLRDAEEAIPALRDMLDCAQRGEFDVVVLYDYSRLRELLDQVSRTLAAYHVQLYSINQPVEPQDPGSYDLYATDTQTAVQFVSKLISSSEISTLQRRKKIGLPNRVSLKGLHPIGVLPYGYRKPPGHERDSSAVPIVDGVIGPILIEAKDRFLAGYSIPQVTDWLNTTGIKPMKRDTWIPMSLYCVLRNPFYAGLVTYGVRKSQRDPRTGTSRAIRVDQSKVVQGRGKHQPLWSEEDFRLIQKEFHRRSRTMKGRQTQRLSGLLFCELCGSALRISYNGDHQYDDEHRGWYCPKCVTPDHRWQVFVRDREVLRDVTVQLTRFFLHKDDLEAPRRENRTPVLTKALEDGLHRIARLQDALEEGVLSVSSYSERVTRLEASVAEIRKRLAEDQQDQDWQASRTRTLNLLAGIVDTIPDYIQTAPPQEVNMTLRRVVEKIVVSRSSIRVEIV